MGYKLEPDSAEVGRLREIQQEMLSLLDEAEGIITQHADTMAATRARSYWIPHIKCALTKEHEYLGGSMHDMDDTIKEMSGGEDDSDDGGEHGNTDDSED